MKFLILGKNGQLGNEIVNYLSSEKMDFIATGREDLDIADIDQLHKLVNLHKPNIIINTCAYQLVDGCEKNPEEAFNVNTIAVKNIAEISREHEAKTITFSTDYVFDGTKGTAYKEDDLPNPLQIYGLSKYAGEVACKNYNENSYIIRTCGLFSGKTGSRTKGNFIINILREAEGKEYIEVNSDQIVNPTYAGDLTLSLFELIKKNAPAGIYHLVSQNSCSWAELATKVMEVAGRSTRIVPVERKGQYGKIRRPLYSVLENTRAKSLGVTLPTWESAVERYFDKYLK